MAYQNVGTPRFYIDQAQYLKSIGFDFKADIENSDYLSAYIDAILNGTINSFSINSQYLSIVSHPELFTLDPTIQKHIEYLGDNPDYSGISYNFICPTGYSHTQNLEGDNIGRYVAILNHNMPDMLNFDWTKSQGDGYDTSFVKILNMMDVTNNISGSTIWELGKNPSGDSFSFNPTEEYKFAHIKYHQPSTGQAPSEPKLGAISWGVYYDMPNSPDLDLTLDIEFTGAKSTDTLGGSTLTNTRYTGAPWWYDVDGNKVEPWAIGESSGTSKRNGRRVWKLSFSFISDENLFASNFMSNNYLETSADNSDYNSNDLASDGNNFEYTLEDDNSFMAQVLNKVSNGQRFIFQPDNTNNNPDQFAICQLDMDTFSIKQTAFKTYEIELEIREVW